MKNGFEALTEFFAPIVAFITFWAIWISTFFIWGFLGGLTIGWLPALIGAGIAALLWPVPVLGVAAILVTIFWDQFIQIVKVFALIAVFGFTIYFAIKLGKKFHKKYKENSLYIKIGDFLEKILLGIKKCANFINRHNTVIGLCIVFAPLLLVIFAIPIIIVGSIFPSTEKAEERTQNAIVETHPPLIVDERDVNEWQQKYETHSFAFPARYFSINQIIRGSVNTERDTDNPYTWEKLIVDEGFQSFPTTTITIDSFSNEIEKLPPMRTMKEILDSYDGTLYKKSIYTEQIEKYGTLADRFLGQDMIIDWRMFFDVDGDGQKEVILGLCRYGGNHCPHQVAIIKDNTIIFSVNAAGLTGLDLVEHPTGNGFYVHWVPTDEEQKWDQGLCCPLGYIRTRFVYENHKFKPIYEQDVWYIEIQNTE